MTKFLKINNLTMDLDYLHYIRNEKILCGEQSGFATNWVGQTNCEKCAGILVKDYIEENSDNG